MLSNFIILWLYQHIAVMKDDEQGTVGQGLVEYALLLILVATVMVAVVAVLGPGIGNVYSNIVHTIETSQQ